MRKHLSRSFGKISGHLVYSRNSAELYFLIPQCVITASLLITCCYPYILTLPKHNITLPFALEFQIKCQAVITGSVPKLLLVGHSSVYNRTLYTYCISLKTTELGNSCVVYLLKLMHELYLYLLGDQVVS